MSRAVLLPSSGNPFLLDYWLRNFSAVYAGEVDELVVYVSGQNDPALRLWLGKRVADAGAGRYVCLFAGRRVEHGDAIDQMLAVTDSEHVMLAEEDAFVRRHGVVSEQFQRLESGAVDVIGSPRGCASKELIDACWARWPDASPTASLDEGHGLWPAFMFTSAEALRATDRRFGARIWQPGEIVEGLGLAAPAVVSADTLVSTCWQLRQQGLVVTHVPQYVVKDPFFISRWLDHEPPWFHVGSLSSGYGMAFADEQGVAPLDVTSENNTAVTEWARRIYWWREAWRCASGSEPLNLIYDQWLRYGYALTELEQTLGIGPGALRAWEDMLAGWVSWDAGGPA